MKNKKSIPIEPKASVSVIWIVDDRKFSITIPSEEEPYYRTAEKMLADSYNAWRVKNADSKTFNDGFSNMNLVALQAMANALQMQEEYQKLLNVVNEGLTTIQDQMPTEDN